MLGYQQWPPRIQPGDPVHLTLYWQDLSAVLTDTAHESTTPFQTILRLVSVADDAIQSQKKYDTQRNAPQNNWPERPLIETNYVLTTTADMPAGAYQVNVSFQDLETSDPWLSIQNNEINFIFDRIPLGFVVVPWQGDMSQAQPVGANFGEQIELLAYKAVGAEGQEASSGTAVSVQPGTTLDVTLYWQARRPPDNNYTVFVHLLDQAGQLVVGHDSQPMAARYPTRLWTPAETVFDPHSLTLPPDLPAGFYALQTGLYQLKTGERLPIRDAQGVEQTDRTLFLQSVIVGQEETTP